MFVILKTNLGKELDMELLNAFEEEILWEDEENGSSLPFSPERIYSKQEAIWLFPKSQWLITSESLTIHGSRNSVRSILNRLDDDFTDRLKYRESSVVVIKSMEKDWKWYDSLGTKFRDYIPAFSWYKSETNWNQFVSEYTHKLLGEYILAEQFEKFIEMSRNFKWIIPKTDKDYERAITWHSRLLDVLDGSGHLDLDHKRDEISQILRELYAAKYGIWV